MVPASSKNIAFKLYDRREGVYSVGDLRFEIADFDTNTKLLSSISIEFTSLVSKICREILLPVA